MRKCHSFASARGVELALVVVDLRQRLGQRPRAPPPARAAKKSPPITASKTWRCATDSARGRGGAGDVDDQVDELRVRLEQREELHPRGQPRRNPSNCRSASSGLAAFAAGPEAVGRSRSKIATARDERSAG
jgi:hypothetical protein